MSIFDKAFDRATGYDSSSSIFSREEEEEDNIFANTFDSVFDQSVFVPNDDLIGSVMRQRTQQPFAEPEMGFGQAEPRIPSRAMPGSGFMVGAREPRQDSAELGAMTELDRNIKLFKELGLEEEFEAEVAASTDSFGFDDIIEPVFDFLSIANYSIAGGLEEYLLTNSPIAGLEQAGEEFLNALPGVEMEGARRTTFSDILSGKRGHTDLTMSEDSPYATAAAGFVLDVILDPTTWFGFGLGKVAIGIGRADKAAGAAMNVRRVSDVVTNSEAGKTFRRMFVPKSLVKGLRDGYQAEEIANTINRIKKEQGSAEVITKEDVMDGGADFLGHMIRRDADIGIQTNALRERILSTAAEMNEGELRLVGAYLDQPDVVDGLIGKLKVDDETKVVIKKGVEGWQEVMQKFFDEEEAVGLLDRAQFRVNYSAGMEPVTELSRSIVETMFKVRFGEDAGSAIYKKASGDGIATVTENGIMKASYAKKYPTLESRLHALVPTETNVALMASRRGVESIKKVNTQRFYDTIISDTRIAVPIDQAVAENARSPLHEMLKEHGMDVWKAPALSIRKGAKQASGEEGIYYAMPSAMKEQLDDMTKMIQGGDEASGLLNTFRQVQGLWKSYALLSPGYHMRNLYSNLFNNYLAGVTNPVRYAEAMLLQVEDTANIGSRAVRSKIERILGGRKTSADYIFTTPDGTKLTGKEVMELANERKVAEAGLIYNESDLGIGADLMTRMQLRKGRPTTSEIDTDMPDWGDRAERISNVGASMLAASKNAGGRLTQEEADKTAEIYDVIARSWAWKNWKTPEEWYENRIREIKAYTLPVPGQPDSGLSELFQTRVYTGIESIDYNSPAFLKAAEKAYWKTGGDELPIFFHGTGNTALRLSGEVDPTQTTSQFMGPGFYMTMDHVRADPTRGPQITTGYMLGLGQSADNYAAYLGQRRFVPMEDFTDATQMRQQALGIYESIPELADELKRFGHDDLLPDELISGTPWEPIGPSPEQLKMIAERESAIWSKLPKSPLKESYKTYIRQRELVETALDSDMDELYGMHYTKDPQEYTKLLQEELEPLLHKKDLRELAVVEFEKLEGRGVRAGERYEYAAVKPPDDEVLRELVALNRYTNQWKKKRDTIVNYFKYVADPDDGGAMMATKEHPDILGFHWFAEKPFITSLADPSGLSAKQLRLGEYINPRPVKGVGGTADAFSRNTAWSKDLYEEETQGVMNSLVDMVASIYTRASMKVSKDPTLLRNLSEHLDEGRFPQVVRDATVQGKMARYGYRADKAKEMAKYKGVKKVFKNDTDLLSKDVLETEDEISRYTTLALEFINKGLAKSDAVDMTAIEKSSATWKHLPDSNTSGWTANKNQMMLDLLELYAPRLALKEVAEKGGPFDEIKTFFKEKDPQKYYDHYKKSFKEVANEDWEEFLKEAADSVRDEVGDMSLDDMGALRLLNTVVPQKDWAAQFTKRDFIGFDTNKENGLSDMISHMITGDSHTIYLDDLLRESAHELGYTGLLAHTIDNESLFKNWMKVGKGTVSEYWLVGEALKKHGYDGLSHAGGANQGADLFHQVGIAYNPEQVKSIENVGTWNLSNKNMYEQHGPEGVQGAIKFLDDGRADIMAMADADPSTFIHELGHLIRRTMLDEGDQDIIQRWILRPENAKTDAQYNKVRAEMVEEAERAAAAAPNAGIDVEDMATQLMERFVWTREGEERFAEGFEQFLLEGVMDKNAGKAMQGTFDYMKEMMDVVYDYSNGGTVGLTVNDETRHVLQNILGRGVETEPEGVAMAEAILGTATTAGESLFSRAYGLLGDNFLTRANRNFGQQMENNSRIAHFITMMMTDTGKIKGNGILNKKATGVGMNADEAAESVRRFLFDYGELTPFERDYMKTVIPFYTWMRKNIPLQFQQIFENPERYSAVPKLQHAIESVSGDWANIPTPDYFSDINAVRMPFTSDEIPLEDNGMPMYFAPDLPYGDLNRLNMKDMVSSMTPFLKTWAEIYPKQGYSFFLDSEIQDYEDQPAVFDFFGSETELPFDEKTYHAIKTLLPPVGKITRLGERASEGKLTEQMLREAAGLNFRSVDIDAVVRAKRFQRREVSRAVKKRLIEKARLMGFEDALEDMQDD